MCEFHLCVSHTCELFPKVCQLATHKTKLWPTIHNSQEKFVFDFVLCVVNWVLNWVISDVSTQWVVNTVTCQLSDLWTQWLVNSVTCELSDLPTHNSPESHNWTPRATIVTRTYKWVLSQSYTRQVTLVNEAWHVTVDTPEWGMTHDTCHMCVGLMTLVINRC